MVAVKAVSQNSNDISFYLLLFSFQLQLSYNIILVSGVHPLIIELSDRPDKPLPHLTPRTVVRILSTLPKLYVPLSLSAFS